MPYHRFLGFNAAGGLVWALRFTLLGYLAGASYQQVETIAGRTSEVVLAVVVLAVVVLAVVVLAVVVLTVVVYVIRRRRDRDT